MDPEQILVWFNMLPFWKRRANAWGYVLNAISFDRLLAIYLHRFGLMGTQDREFLAQRVRPGMHVVEIGANHGLYTLLLSDLVGDSGTVTAFEPDPELFEALQANCRMNSVSNVQFYNLAVGARPDFLTLSRSLVHAGDNRMTPTHRSIFSRKVETQVETLDRVLANQSIDFIKLDVQGWEGEVLAGMEKVAECSPSLEIYFEYWPYGLRLAGCEPTELLGRVKKLGFDIYHPSRTGRTPIDDPATFTSRIRGRAYTNLHAVRRGRTEPAMTSV